MALLAVTALYSSANSSATQDMLCVFVCACVRSSCKASTYQLLIRTDPKNSTPWPESESELYRPSDRRLSVKLVPTFASRVPRGQRGGSLRPALT
jgi:hypothetical protein